MSNTDILEKLHRHYNIGMMKPGCVHRNIPTGATPCLAWMRSNLVHDTRFTEPITYTITTMPTTASISSVTIG